MNIVHEILLNIHEQFHEHIMNHEMFMNSYFHELCHLTFMRKFMNIFHESS